MKTILLIFAIMFIPIAVIADTDEKQVSINVIQPKNNGVPDEVNRYLATKMQQMASINGLADNGLNERFVLTAKVSVVSKDIVPSTPARISQKLVITFLVGDILENKLYETCSINVIGVGENETKAFISAFCNLKIDNKSYSDFLDKAKREIVEYYTNNCEEILKKAATLTEIGRYDEAIYMLMSVPNICEECYERCLSTVVPLYAKKIDNEAKVLIGNARAIWTSDQTKVGASQALKQLAKVNPQSAYYKQVEELFNEIGTKLRDDEKREWNMQVKQYEDSRKLEQSIVKACRDIGVAWGQNQPRTEYSYIISLW